VLTGIEKSVQPEFLDDREDVRHQKEKIRSHEQSPTGQFQVAKDDIKKRPPGNKDNHDKDFGGQRHDFLTSCERIPPKGSFVITAATNVNHSGMGMYYPGYKHSLMDVSSDPEMFGSFEQSARMDEAMKSGMLNRLYY
jgi:hypothetical protein